jgi:hypothetical protein
LFVANFLVCRHEDIERYRSGGEEFAVFKPPPAHVARMKYLVTGEKAFCPVMNAVVEENLHNDRTRLMKSDAARSITATACSRDTSGNPSRKDSMGSPA